MPVYEYLCDDGHIVEVTHSVDEEPFRVCLADGIHQANGDLVLCGKPCRRLIGTGTGFILKGKGWAKDGYN